MRISKSTAKTIEKINGWLSQLNKDSGFAFVRYNREFGAYEDVHGPFLVKKITPGIVEKAPAFLCIKKYDLIRESELIVCNYHISYRDGTYDLRPYNILKMTKGRRSAKERMNLSISDSLPPVIIDGYKNRDLRILNAAEMQERLDFFQNTLREIEERKQRLERWKQEKEQAEKQRSQSADEEAAGSGYEQLMLDIDQAAETGNRAGD